MSNLSDRIRPNSEAAPWVCDEVKKLERQRDEYRNHMLKYAEHARLSAAAHDLAYKERDEARENAKHWCDMHILATKDFNKARELARELRDALVSIEEYWNRDQNETAMADACWHAVNTSQDALTKAKEVLP